MKETYEIEFVTPCFCRGIDNRDEAEPEIRPPSIRGQLRYWYRILHTNPAQAPHQEKEIFGGVHGKASSSPLITRVSDVKGDTRQVPTLPHKQGGHAAPKKAYLAGTTFKLHLLERRQGLREDQAEAVKKATRGWLLLGGLGLRVTRTGGSLHWEGMPTSPDQYQQMTEQLLQGTKVKAAVLNKDFQSAEAARTVATDTIGGRFGGCENELRNMNYPLGNMVRPRKTSPMRFT